MKTNIFTFVLTATVALFALTGQARYRPTLRVTTPTPTEIVASTLWLESRGEGKRGIKAVASVIWTRAQKTEAHPQDVCLRPNQFGCWAEFRPIRTPYGAEGTDLWDYCVKLAKELQQGTFTPLFKATHYYNPRVCTPYWAKKMKIVTRIGNHVFGVAK